MTKTRSDLIQDWCEKGRRDIITAQNSLLETNEIFPDIVCFHAQQAAEKYLKAYLVFLEQDFPKIHALLRSRPYRLIKRSHVQEYFYRCM